MFTKNLTTQNAPVHPEKFKRIIYWLGLSLAASQQLEEAVKLLLWTLTQMGAVGSLSQEQTTAMMEGQAKETLGKLLHLVHGVLKFSPGWDTQLEQSLQARNIVVHRFMIENAERCLTEEGRETVFRDLKTLRQRILDGIDVIEHALVAHYALLGLDMMDIQERFHAEVRLRTAEQQ